MNFLVRALRFLFWLLVISWGVRILLRFVVAMLRNVGSDSGRTAKTPRADQMPGTARWLMRDPVCDAHVDETLSIPFWHQGELLHFCSIACRDKFATGMQKFAASG